ncbi:cache domain-containing protein [Arcobacter sp. CECT 8985]|uniref:sensor histidine kinase n=1 Tax=Arcobacter sp. CECT 8985 TaxID=1935424 RepID=UPI00100B4B67|nr:cache domain-containing protein [Arcobacter sp. CECT 8985]RXJ86017.1 histidine kinase [Arcobacter sp. CECT 8985]
MFKAKSLYQLIVYSIIFIIILISFFTVIIIDNTFDEFQEKIKIIKTNYISKQKEIIKQDITNTIKFIEFYHNINKGKKSEEQIKKDVIHAIEKMKNYNDVDDYTFIYDFKGTSIYYPIGKTGRNLLEYMDKNGTSVIKDLINVSKKPAGGFVKYTWYKPEIKKETNKISFAMSYKPWNWTVGKGVYLDNIKKLVREKENEYDEKISNSTLQITSLTIMLVLYSIFIFKNATLLIANEVKEIGNYFKKSQIDEHHHPINNDNLVLNEFRTIVNYANEALTSIKYKKHLVEDLNKNLENSVKEKTKELTNLIESQKQFLKNSVHEINTPLAIIQTNIDLLKRDTPKNKYITNIESGCKIIQNIYNDLSFMIKKDRVEYKKEYLNFSEILNSRIEFFAEVAKSNSLFFIANVQEDIYIKFNKTQLQRVIDNNISNAIKYSYAKSPIYIKLKYLNDEKIEFQVKTASEKIENKDKIFNDFYRENNARGGFGLGLRIVKEICDKNLVIIKLDSNEQETKFTYRFNINENTTS